MMPIDRAIFNKMIFCEEVFRFLNLEETLYFTKLDVELNSITKPIDEQQLLSINHKNLSNTFTCNVKGVKSEVKAVASPSNEDIKKLIDEHSAQSAEVSSKVYS